MAMARQSSLCVAGSCQLWYLFMALSSDASAGAALARTVEHAVDEPVGVGHQFARHPGAGRLELLLYRTSPNGLGQAPF